MDKVSILDKLCLYHRSLVNIKQSIIDIKLHDIVAYLHFMSYTILPSLPCLSEKTYVAPCFSLKIGRSDMTCFLLLHSRYDMEVMFHLSYGYDMDIYVTLWC